MKRLLIVALLFLLTGLSMSADAIRAPRGFSGKLWASTMVLYGSDDGVNITIGCTAEPYQKIAGGYRLLSAGHCAPRNQPNLKFFVADEVNGSPTPVTLVKAHFGDGFDFSIFDLKTTKHYPLFVLGDDNSLQVGDEVIVVHFALSLGKQVSMGRISSASLGESGECLGTCIDSFLIQLSGGGAGASGAAVVSKKTHKVIGLLVGEWDQPVGFGIEPISRFAQFINAPAQAISKDESSDESYSSKRIPDDVFKGLFGEEHPFALAVHGPNPVFVQAGYAFQARTAGFELSDEYYYDVPVAITIADDGQYRLTSTKDGVSVPVVVTEVPK
jgi:trypsin-like peptidase